MTTLISVNAKCWSRHLEVAYFYCCLIFLVYARLEIEVTYVSAMLIAHDITIKRRQIYENLLSIVIDCQFDANKIQFASILVK